MKLLKRWPLVIACAVVPIMAEKDIRRERERNITKSALHIISPSTLAAVLILLFSVYIKISQKKKLVLITYWLSFRLSLFPSILLASSPRTTTKSDGAFRGRTLRPGTRLVAVLSQTDTTGSSVFKKSHAISCERDDYP